MNKGLNYLFGRMDLVERALVKQLKTNKRTKLAIFGVGVYAVLTKLELNAQKDKVDLLARRVKDLEEERGEA